MAQRILESSSGIGTLHRADGEVEVRYSLVLTQDMISIGGGETVPGLKDGHGAFTSLDDSLFLDPGGEFDLELSDGRHTRILIRSSNFPSGRYEFLVNGPVTGS
jgi:hypothetical protein